MKLSSLVAYKSLLEFWHPNDAKLIVNKEFGKSLVVTQNEEIQLVPLIKKINDNYQQIENSIQQFNDTFDDIIKEVQTQIELLQPAYFNRSYQLYDQEMRYDTADHILDRRISLTQTSRDYLMARIMPHSNWQHAGLIIRPGREEWIEHLVGLDPLYLADQFHDLFEPTKSKFNDAYQSRLRYSIIDESADRVLTSVPDQQIGFCLAYYFFNFKPLEIVKKYLDDIYAKLKPGGTLMMTINDCDRVGAVKLAEQNFMCYTPGELVRSLAVSMGYEIYNIYEIDAACSWIELKKPGRLTSLRGGQSLAKIIEKSK